MREREREGENSFRKEDVVEGKLYSEVEKNKRRMSLRMKYNRSSCKWRFEESK